MISVIIPTYNEASTIREVLIRAARALQATGQRFQLIVVDDSSPDGTAEVAESMARELPVCVLKRSGRSGLATAVVAGWNLAHGGLLGVMDGDLQHPPELLTDLARAMDDPAVDVAIASRYVDGGGTSDWSWRRRIVSGLATHAALCVLPWVLASISDPMSGMFLFRARLIQGVRLNPAGYKILLEVLAKSRARTRVEVPFVFGRRGQGSSKLGPRQYFEYLWHLLRLAWETGQMSRWLQFIFVGFGGCAVSMSILLLLVLRIGVPLLPATVAAIEISITSNFFVNQLLTFRLSSHASRPADRRKLLHYQLVCLPGALANVTVTLLSAAIWHNLVLAAIAGPLTNGVWNVLFNIPAIWRIWTPPYLVSSRFSVHAGFTT